MASLLRRVVVAVSLVLVPAAAWAQTDMFPPNQTPQTNRGQDRGIFGGGVGSADQVLSANSNVGVTYFDSLSGVPTVAGGEPLPSATFFGQGSGFLAYRLAEKSLAINATGGEFSYYFRDQNRWYRRAIASASASYSHNWQLSQRTQFSVSEVAEAEPAYYSALPAGYQPQLSTADPALTLPPDLTGFEGAFLDSQSAAAVTHNLTRRVSLTGTYNFMRRWSVDRPDNLDLMQYSGQAEVRYSVTRHLSVRTGYRAYDSRFGPPDSPHMRTQTADFGIDYNRGGSLQLTRRTTLSFNVGAAGVTDSAGTKRFVFLGGAGLAHEMGRTWSSTVRYDRGLQFESIFQEPVLTDTVSAQMTGLITSRLQFQSGAGYSRGDVGLVGGAGNGMEIAYGLVGIRSAITRYLAVGTNYSYYRRTVGDQVTLPIGLSRYSDSQSVRVYLSTWVPLFTRTRRPNATR